MSHREPGRRQDNERKKRRRIARAILGGKPGPLLPTAEAGSPSSGWRAAREVVIGDRRCALIGSS